MNETTFAAFIVIAAIGLFLTSTPETKKEELTFPEVDSKPIVSKLLKEDKRRGSSRQANHKSRKISAYQHNTSR